MIALDGRSCLLLCSLPSESSLLFAQFENVYKRLVVIFASPRAPLNGGNNIIRPKTQFKMFQRMNSKKWTQKFKITVVAN